METNPTYLLSKLGITIPLIGVYDTPDLSVFSDVLKIKSEGRGTCLFAYYKKWLEGKHLLLTKDNHGCRGCGNWWWDVQKRSREDFVDFLVHDEGLKVDGETMNAWLDVNHTYKASHENIVVGPLIEKASDYLKTVSFFVNPDQLSALITGAHYFQKPGDYSPVIAPFGSGCMEFLTMFDDFDNPMAIIGSTDIAMRQFLPANIMIFSVTVPMFKLLCSLGEKSFLNKPFLERLIKSRGGSL
ncbi:MAG: DUF169 domain-containing protein [Bacteroidales bacterium]|nr:DUF169 domain-containing protein [Bacteroidales bacterium]MCF8456720.1 DUF169 domain-containing protein [Bacteroidales bacterium]